jgi:lysine-N-methylase
MGERLRASIDLDSDTPHFRLGENERCPFLNKTGLCDLITALGEDSLCQICADHPRFRNFFADRTEIGLGLCCEAAAQLILSWPDKVTLVTLEDDGNEDALPEEDALVIAQRDALVSIAQKRTLSMEERIAQLEDVCGAAFPPEDMPRWAAVLLELERLAEAWTRQLTLLQSAEPREKKLSDQWAVHFEQLLVYLLYRHIPGALDDGDIQGRLMLCLLGWHVIRRLFLLQEAQTLDTLAELCRMFSSEIEYSDDNLSALLDVLDEGGLYEADFLER